MRLLHEERLKTMIFIFSPVKRLILLITLFRVLLRKYLEKLAAVTGRKYGLFDYYGDPEAERVIIAMACY